MLESDLKSKHFFANTANYSGWLRSSAISKHLAIYELYKKIINTPGSIAEFGVWRGSTFFFLAKLIEIFNHSSYEPSGMSNRKLYGFDTFSGFPSLSENDKTEIIHKERKVNGLNFDSDIFYSAYKHMISESKISNRINIIKGDVNETWPNFIKSNNGVMFSLVILDMDIFEPTATVLENLIDFMVPGGIIIFDEYAYPEWPGETKAVNNFIKLNNLSLKSFNWSYAPSAYVILPS